MYNENQTVFSPLECSHTALHIFSLGMAHFSVKYILYFFGYKTAFFFQNNPKNLDPSYKTYLDLWDCLGWVKLIL